MPEERKLVTVLFADVTGSTALGDDLDPEDVRALMGRYYEHARRVVSGHGGTLEKFIGDAVMAVFGLPHVHGDDAERAVAAALALREAVDDDPLLADMRLRIGLNTGEVIATSDPSGGDFLVTGDAVNVAARVQQSANPDEVLVSERTHSAAEMAFLFAHPRAVEVKGKREPLQVFPLVRMHPIRHVERPPFVGRKREIAQLSLLQSSALEEQRPQLVSIVAPAGAGKTRLLEEFLASIDSDQACQVSIGRCPPYGQSLTCWPLRGLLEDLVGAVDRSRVLDAFIRGSHGSEDAARLTDLVLAPLGIESEILTEPESIFAAWRLLIETLAQQAPCILVFEDLHWASDSLLELVEYVMQPRTRGPLLLIVTSRPELLDRRPTWGGGGRQNFSAFVLGSLNEGQTTELVAHLGSDLPAALQQRIVERSGGNPFFATELVRGLAERGIESEAQGPDVVPDTVHAAVLARLDALSTAERTVAQAASVVGRIFRPATLAALAPDLPLAEIDAAIDGLVSRDLAVPSEGDTYTFRHVLIQDVAYGTLSRAERIRMHAAVAAWLEEYAADRSEEFAELIAHHYREAVTLSRSSAVPLPLPFDASKAVFFLERAGDLASRLGAVVEASQHIQSAIAIASEEEHIRLYEKLGDCAPGGTTALTAYQEALQRWRDAEMRGPLIGARLLRKLLALYTRWLDFTKLRPSYDALVEMGAEARRLADDAGDEDEIWRVRVGEILLLDWRGTITEEEATDGGQTALAAAAYFERREDWLSFSEALEAYIHIAEVIGMHEDIIEAAQRRLAVPSLPLREYGEALNWLLQAHFAEARFDQCISLMREALAQIRPGDPLLGCARGLETANIAAYLCGRWHDVDAFMALIEEARGQHRDAEFLRGTYWLALSVATARNDRAAVETIASTLTRLYTLDQPLNGEEAGAILFTRAWLAALLEDDAGTLDLDVLEHTLLQHIHHDARGALVHTLMFLNEHGVGLDETYLGSLAEKAEAAHWNPLLRTTEIARALTAADPGRLKDAIDEAERHGLIPHAARMRIILAQMTCDAAPLDQARPVLERLEDRQGLRRLEDVATS